MTLPSGATTSYTFDCMDYTSSCFDPEFVAPNAITSKTVVWTDVNGQQHTEPYQYQISGGTTLDNIYGRWSYQVKAPDNGVTRVKHYGSGVPVLRTVKPSGDSEDLWYQCVQPPTIESSSVCANQYIAERVTTKLNTIASDSTPSDWNYQMLTAPLTTPPSPTLKQSSKIYALVTPDAASNIDSTNAY